MFKTESLPFDDAIGAIVEVHRDGSITATYVIDGTPFHVEHFTAAEVLAAKVKVADNMAYQYPGYSVPIADRQHYNRRNPIGFQTEAKG